MSEKKPIDINKKVKIIADSSEKPHTKIKKKESVDMSNDIIEPLLQGPPEAIESTDILRWGSFGGDPFIRRNPSDMSRIFHK